MVSESSESSPRGGRGLKSPVSSRRRSGRPRPITVIRAGSKGVHASLFERLGIAALKFFGTGDVGHMTREEILDHLALVYPDDSQAQYVQHARQVHFFAHVLDIGDIIATPEMASREILIGEIIGPYEFLPEGAVGRDFKHVRRTRWLGRRSRDDLSAATKRSLSGRATVFRPDPDAQAELSDMIGGQAGGQRT